MNNSKHQESKPRGEMRAWRSRTPHQRSMVNKTLELQRDPNQLPEKKHGFKRGPIKKIDLIDHRAAKQRKLSQILSKKYEIPIGMPIMYTQTTEPLMKILKSRTPVQEAEKQLAIHKFGLNLMKMKESSTPKQLAEAQQIYDMLLSPEFEEPLKLEIEKQLYYLWFKIPRPNGWVGEVKRVDGFIPSTNLTATGAVAPVFNVPQGDGIGQRIGDRIWVKRIKLRITINAANSDVFSLCNMFLVVWIPNMSLDTPNIGYFKLNSSEVAQSLQNYQLYPNYHMLWDWHQEFTGTNTVPTTGSAFTFTIDIPLEFMVTYLTASSSASSCTVLLGTSADSAITPFPAYDASGELSFVDC